jgi:hypothetical protein
LTFTKKESFTVDSNHPVTIRAVGNLTEDSAANSYKLTLTLTNAKTTE